jgi:hypothetical protein
MKLLDGHRGLFEFVVVGFCSNFIKPLFPACTIKEINANEISKNCLMLTSRIVEKVLYTPQNYGKNKEKTNNKVLHCNL